ncbi:MAG: hypothetical protein U0R64_03580 [Candidatus Nanopelagicales bacterium]
MAQDAAAVRLPGVLWHVTVTLHGQPQRPDELADVLAELAFHHGFDLSVRYTPDTVELRYWDEGTDCRTVAAAALDLWDAHRADLSLPAWPVVGVEVLDRAAFRRRWPDGASSEVFTPGVRPLP